jgi:hypothetical protein
METQNLRSEIRSSEDGRKSEGENRKTEFGDSKNEKKRMFRNGAIYGDS